MTSLRFNKNCIFGWRLQVLSRSIVPLRSDLSHWFCSNGSGILLDILAYIFFIKNLGQASVLKVSWFCFCDFEDSKFLLKQFLMIFLKVWDTRQNNGIYSDTASKAKSSLTLAANLTGKLQTLHQDQKSLKTERLQFCS